MISTKFNKLVSTIQGYRKVAIAFSGGVDSTLLLYAARIALGKKNVVALNLLTTVNSKITIANSRSIIETHFGGEILYKEIEADPLEWGRFTANTEERCYFCKKQMYSLLLDAMKEYSCDLLLDGTNVNDKEEGRPGLKAIAELSVKTPLLDAGLTKTEIRALSQENGLVNHDLPSNSCLATRIPTGQNITQELLQEIENAEAFLNSLGFDGCRVRPLTSHAVVELQEKHLIEAISIEKRHKIESFFSTSTLGLPALGFKGR